VGSNTGGRDSVEILGADRDTSNQACEGSSVFGDGRLEGGDFSLDSSFSTRGPETEQEGCVFGNGSGNGLCGFVGRASSLDHGVQAGTGEARGAYEVLGRLEKALEVGLVSECSTIRLG
jgi:hypothetical protein